jgi:hypothetical protein
MEGSIDDVANRGAVSFLSEMRMRTTVDPWKGQ